MSQLYNFYKSSPVKIKRFKRNWKYSQSAWNKTETGHGCTLVEPSKSSGVVKSALPAIVESLSCEGSERHNATAVGLHHYAVTYKCLAFAHMLYTSTGSPKFFSQPVCELWCHLANSRGDEINPQGYSHFPNRSRRSTKRHPGKATYDSWVWTPLGWRHHPRQLSFILRKHLHALHGSNPF